MNNDIPIDPGNFFGQMTSVLGGLFLLLLGTAIFSPAMNFPSDHHPPTTLAGCPHVRTSVHGF